mmetsp:Transcript_127/g.328  ORF Transcript_127/g.328 Transcript_127/m.328 type:complete len:271 (+) Transcript_127:301-1113(+)
MVLGRLRSRPVGQILPTIVTLFHHRITFRIETDQLNRTIVKVVVVRYPSVGNKVVLLPLLTLSHTNTNTRIDTEKYDYHHHHQDDCTLFANAGSFLHKSSQTGILEQPRLSQLLLPNSLSMRHKNGKPAQSATVGLSVPARKQQLGPFCGVVCCCFVSIRASNSRSLDHIRSLSPPRTALFPMGRNSFRAYRKALILTRVASSSGAVTKDSSVVTTTTESITVLISSRIKSESASTTCSFSLPLSLLITRTGTVPFGFSFINHGGFPPPP